MSYGITIYSSLDTIQISDATLNSRMFLGGSSSYSSTEGHHAYINMPYNVKEEPPVVLVRPSVAESYVGAVMVLKNDSYYYAGQNGAYGRIRILGQAAFSWAVFSTRGVAIADNELYGLNVFSSTGQLSFSSNHRQARIMSLHYRPPYSAGNWPRSFSISGHTQMPWIIANPLTVTWYGVGDLSENLGCLMAKINSSYSALTVELGDAAGGPLKVLPASFRNQDPYRGRPFWIGVGSYA